MSRIIGTDPPKVGTRTIGTSDWDSRDEEQRRKFLDDLFIARGLRRRDVADVAVEAASEVVIRRFVEGIQNVVGPFQGTAAVPTPEGTIPAKGVPGRWYALYRDFEDIELPGGVFAADPQHAREVCGVWFGD